MAIWRFLKKHQHGFFRAENENLWGEKRNSGPKRSNNTAAVHLLFQLNGQWARKRKRQGFTSLHVVDKLSRIFHRGQWHGYSLLMILSIFPTATRKLFRRWNTGRSMSNFYNNDTNQLKPGVSVVVRHWSQTFVHKSSQGPQFLCMTKIFRQHIRSDRTVALLSSVAKTWNFSELRHLRHLKKRCLKHVFLENRRLWWTWYWCVSDVQP